MTDGSALAFWQMLPILLGLCIFCGGILVRIVIKRAAEPEKDYNYQPMVSILLPVYNEGEHVLKTIDSILAADWPEDKLEIIATDDKSVDESYFWLHKARFKYPQRRIKIGRKSTNRGKHAALMAGLKEAKGEIVICIDSDCIFDKNVIRELIACFANPKIAAVGGHVGIINVNESIFTVCQTVMYFLAFQVMKLLQNADKKVFCISGCLFAVRRDVFKKAGKEISRRRWLGMEMRDGEDLYTTHAILVRGWNTVFNPKAVCWTSAPATMKQLFSQQLRWRRSGIRGLLWVIFNLRKYLRTFSLKTLFLLLFQELFVIFWAFYLISLIPLQGIGVAITTAGQSSILYAVIFIFSAFMYNNLIKKIAVGSESIRNPLLTAAAGIWFYMDFMVITLLALMTLDVGAWGTREAKAEGSEEDKSTLLTTTQSQSRNQTGFAVQKHAPNRISNNNVTLEQSLKMKERKNPIAAAKRKIIKGIPNVETQQS